MNIAESSYVAEPQIPDVAANQTVTTSPTTQPRDVLDEDLQQWKTIFNMQDYHSLLKILKDSKSENLYSKLYSTRDDHEDTKPISVFPPGLVKRLPEFQIL